MFGYKFPLIKTIDDVLPAIQGSDEFKVFQKEEYDVINYMLAGNDTFPPIQNENDAIRRECRGLIFDKKGKLIRRAYHKFFNWGERLETQLEHADFEQEHVILDKLDGSMVTPMYIGNNLRWATKAGITDVSMQAELFVAEHMYYHRFAQELLAFDLLPIFEWCSRKNRIIMDHPVDKLVLTGARWQTSGLYVAHDGMKLGLLKKYPEIPFVQAVYPEVLELVYDSDNNEGVVVRFNNGHMLKVKSDWYCQIHRVKENIAHEKRVIQLIIDGNIDDAMPHMIDDDKVRLQDFVTKFVTGMAFKMRELEALWAEAKTMTRKDYALNIAPQRNSIENAIIFSSWDNPELIYGSMQNLIKKNLGSQSAVDKVRLLWGGAKWNFQESIE